jgi:cytochrome c
MQNFDLVRDDNSSLRFESRPAADTAVGRKRIAFATVLVTIAAMASLGFIHPFGNPRTESSGKAMGGRMLAANMPRNARDVLMEKCGDCHSDETHYPLYAGIAPGSWLIERDIVEGRRHLNLSQWDELSAENRESLVAKIVMEAKSGDMPPPQYLALHWNARLSQGDLLALKSLASTDDTNSAGDASSAVQGDPSRGKLVFEKRCIDCHSMNKNMKGPMLGGLMGKKAASVPKFSYSSPLRKSGLVWTEATLDKWLADPDTLVPDTTMEYRVKNAEERRDLIAFLLK